MNQKQRLQRLEQQRSERCPTRGQVIRDQGGDVVIQLRWPEDPDEDEAPREGRRSHAYREGGGDG